MTELFEERIHGVAALDHPLSRRVYELLVEHGEISRDATAAALDVARSVAAFHLDKLVDAGLADVRYERLTGRTGPGAGRTAKLYRRSARELGVSLPPRQYDLAGSLLAEAVERSITDGIPVETALREAATEAGRRIGEAARRPQRARHDRPAQCDELIEILRGNGYEPRLLGDEIVMANCPFHALAEQHRTLVCGLNLQLLTGVIDGLARDGKVTARLQPTPGNCCVRMSTD